jgi:hypothetical protein
MRQSQVFGGGGSGFGQYPLRHEEYVYSESEAASGNYEKYQNALRGFLGNGDIVTTETVNLFRYYDAGDALLWTKTLADFTGTDSLLGFWMDNGLLYVVTFTKSNTSASFDTVDIGGTVTPLGSVDTTLLPTSADWHTVTPYSAGSSCAHPIQGTTHCIVLAKNNTGVVTANYVILDYSALTIITTGTTLAVEEFQATMLPPDNNGWALFPDRAGTSPQQTLHRVTGNLSPGYKSFVPADFESVVAFYNLNYKYVFMAGEVWSVRPVLDGHSTEELPLLFRITEMDSLTNINAEYLAMYNVPA